MGIKVIFLDIDGVLNTWYTKTETSYGSTFVDDRKIRILKEIINRTNAKVVLSSTWRIGWEHIERGHRDTWAANDFMELRNKLFEYGIELYDKTPMLDKYGRCRGEEIDAWLHNPLHENVDGYVIIDDLSGKWLRPCSSHLLQTSEMKGLEEKHIKVAERIMEMK